jgi:hypothetical protein
MSANSGAHSVRGGLNQSGGSYFMALSDLASLTYTITTAATNSGGAATKPVLTLTTMEDIMEAGSPSVPLSAADAAAFVAAGSLLKDMGKTVVALNGRTYRKFAVAATGAQFEKSFGVAGNPAAAPNTGYASFYLDVTRDAGSVAASATLTPAPILRCF